MILEKKKLEISAMLLILVFACVGIYLFQKNAQENLQIDASREYREDEHGPNAPIPFDTKQISPDEFIDMTAQTPEEAEELRKIFNSAN